MRASLLHRIRDLGGTEEAGWGGGVRRQMVRDQRSLPSYQRCAATLPSVRYLPIKRAVSAYHRCATALSNVRYQPTEGAVPSYQTCGISLPRGRYLPIKRAVSAYRGSAIALSTTSTHAPCPSAGSFPSLVPHRCAPPGKPCTYLTIKSELGAAPLCTAW